MKRSEDVKLAEFTAPLFDADGGGLKCQKEGGTVFYNEVSDLMKTGLLRAQEFGVGRGNDAKASRGVKHRERLDKVIALSDFNFARKIVMRQTRQLLPKAGKDGGNTYSEDPQCPTTHTKDRLIDEPLAMLQGRLEAGTSVSFGLLFGGQYLCGWARTTRGARDCESTSADA